MHNGHIPESVFEVRGMDKTMQRSAKAQQDKQFKVMLTERSGYSPTKGLSKARDDVLNHSRVSTGSSQMRTGRESQLKKGMGGISQRSPQRPPDSTRPPVVKNSPPKPKPVMHTTRPKKQ